MSALEYYRQAPPVSRTLALSTITLSLLCYTGVVNFAYVFFHSSYLTSFPPQIWRLVTSFLITGPQLGMVFDTFFIFTYGSKLETTSSRFSQPGDFMTYLIFVCITILGLNVALTDGMLFCSALVLALTYTSTQDDRGMKQTFVVITVPSQFIPYMMLLMTFVMLGPDAAKVQGTGLVAAHLHDFLTRLWPTFGGGSNLLPTPRFIARFFQSTQATTTDKSYGTSFRPAEREAGGSVLPESWKARGSGHRLGGD